MSAAGPASRGVPAPDIALAERLFEELRLRTSDPSGITRMSYGPGEAIAHAIFTREAKALGLTVETDAACNLYATLPGAAEVGQRIAIGSHLDSVPMGGNYDGAAGVLMGLSVVSGLVEAGCVLPAPITIMVFRAEESAWFGSSYIGSRAAVGMLGRDELVAVRRAGDGMLLRDAMLACGGRPDDLAKGIPFKTAQDIGIFIEPHIEQGAVLSLRDKPVGIVTDIRGSLRHRHAVCHGAYAHSGTTPYEARQDAVRAVATLVVELDSMWQGLRDAGDDLTITIGQFNTDPDVASFSKIAGLVRFSIDIRSNSADTLLRVAGTLENMVARIATEQSVRFDLGPRSSTRAAAMHPAVAERLAQAGDASAIPWIYMPCGAGHDAATFAGLGVPTGMLFIRNENGSHNPDEAMAIEDFGRAAEILMHFCLDPPDLR